MIKPQCLSRHFLAALLLVPLSVLHAADASKSMTKPNIVVILADDLGYGDVQCYNPQRGKILTPHIDRLAAQGMRFTDGHSSSAVCSPSRYTLLTGRYHWRTRLQAGIVMPWEKPLIAPDRLTIAGLAKQHGYKTAAIGKWHLGWDWPRENGKPVFDRPIAGGPTTRGFDSYFGTDVPNWPPFCFIENDRTLGLPSEVLPIRMLTGSQGSKQGPALKDWKFEPILPALGDRSIRFIEESARKKEPFLLYLPLTSPHTPIAVNEEWKGKSGLNAYADFVMETDDVVGRVMAVLAKNGLADNTLVVLTSDNGCTNHAQPGQLEKMGHYPSGPLRGYKFSVWEGGHRVPFIVRWPGVAKAGAVCGQLVHQADLIATVADILGAKLPENAGEDSFSLVPLLKGSDKPIRPHAVSCGGVPGLRRGDWKLIPNAKPELYNLADDIGETNNLADSKSELVAEMKALLEKLITDGRSTPGEPQKNDIEVRRFPQKEPTKTKKAKQ